MIRSVGFVGLGNMGGRMALRLVEAGYPLTVYNRTEERAKVLAERGARLAKSPAEAAKSADLVISMVADGDALLDVALGTLGIVEGARSGAIYVDMSTVSPAASAEVATACGRAGVSYLRSPVTGSTYAAEAGTLTLLVSGPREALNEAADVLRHLGPDHHYIGEDEEARILKLAINLVIGSTMVAFAEAAVLTEKAGLDWKRVLEVFSVSAIASPFLKFKASQLADRNFNAAFTSRMMSKDFDLAIELAKNEDVAVPMASLARQLLQATIGSGHGSRDFASVVLMFERAAGLDASNHG